MSRRARSPVPPKAGGPGAASASGRRARADSVQSFASFSDVAHEQDTAKQKQGAPPPADELADGGQDGQDAPFDEDLEAAQGVAADDYGAEDGFGAPTATGGAGRGGNRRQSIYQQAPIGPTGWVPRIMLGLRAGTTLIGLIIELMLAFQNIQLYLSFMRDGPQDPTVTPASSSKGNSTSRTPRITARPPTDNDLLGRRGLVQGLLELASPYVELARRADKPASSSTSSSLDAAAASDSASIIEYYIPDSDIPRRPGAVGFNICSHLFVGVLFGLLLWLDWREFRGQRNFTGRWTPAVIGGAQCLIAFDLLGRNVSKVAQGGAYLLFIFSLANISYGVYTALHYPSYPYGEEEEPYVGDEQYDQDGGYQEEAEPPLADEKGEIDPVAGAEPEAQDEAEGAAAGSRQERKDRRRSRHAPSVLTTSTGDTGDLDSYYTRSPTLRAAPARLSRSDRRQSSRPHNAHARVAFPQPTMPSHGGYLHPSRVAGHAFPQPAPMPMMQEPAFMAGPPASPISLYGPAEQARRVEAQRRSRRLSLTAAPAGPVPGQDAANFHERSFGTAGPGLGYQAPMPEEEEEEQLGVLQQRGMYQAGSPAQAASARVSRDGFAHRAKEWKKLQKM